MQAAFLTAMLVIIGAVVVLAVLLAVVGALGLENYQPKYVRRVNTSRCPYCKGDHHDAAVRRACYLRRHGVGS